MKYFQFHLDTGNENRIKYTNFRARLVRSFRLQQTHHKLDVLPSVPGVFLGAVDDDVTRALLRAMLTVEFEVSAGPTLLLMVQGV